MSQKKIAIITIYDLLNYGNRLQNYAVINIFNKIGYDCVTIALNNDSKIKYFIKYFCEKILHIGFAKNKLDRNKKTKFLKFTNEYIPTVYLWNKNEKKKKKILQKYDYFVAGSDQVWNPQFSTTQKENFLYFTDKKKKICLSPSFGVDEIPKEYQANFREWLSGLNYISVREESGKKIVKELVGKDAQVLIDPTLMIDAKEWLKISEKIKINSSNFLLIYFLGKTTKETFLKINNISKKNNLEIINMADKSVTEYYTASPAQFIYLVSNAKLIFTDSFHVTVFSILFAKPFVVFRREGIHKDMFSRIETLLNKLKLTRKISENINFDNLYEADYSESFKILEEERKKFYDFLKKSLPIN